MSSSPRILEFDSVEKSFFGVKVLKAVTFDLRTGTAIGLVGENGAGKSTLMNILGGIHTPDAGYIRMEGEPYAPRNPQDAARAGVAFIHQELNLFSNLTIAENIFITTFPRVAGLPMIARKTVRERARSLLDQVGLSVNPNTRVESLSAGERQLVEIAKALSLDARIIIFDEPTSSLTALETDRLFELISTLRARGISMIYISHALSDVMKLCDDIVVLRDGEVVGKSRTAETSTAKLISLMVGRSIDQLYPERTGRPAAERALSVRNLSQPGIVRNIAFDLHDQEILGISGLMGSGRSELARILFGLDPFETGEVLLWGENLPKPSPRQCVRMGMAFLTENRREEGLCMEASIAENMALVSLPNFANRGGYWIDHGRLSKSLTALRGAVRLTRSARLSQAVRTLSGGNQQKVVLAKWLLNRPRVFILDEPTRGIDVGAKYEVYSLINKLASDGAAVLIISSEIEELIGMCDQILVMRNGEIADTIRRPDFDRERILRGALKQSHTTRTSPVETARHDPESR
ncbi:MAG: sugar ABC transporter ATP-binding protein [Verrucomicrobia bacterium]|nr:sugar ABC transporter ATP-binding protein [Verrucomicrobiota bacterium]